MQSIFSFFDINFRWLHEISRLTPLVGLNVLCNFRCLNNCATSYGLNILCNLLSNLDAFTYLCNLGSSLYLQNNFRLLLYTFGLPQSRIRQATFIRMVFKSTNISNQCCNFRLSSLALGSMQIEFVVQRSDLEIILQELQLSELILAH